MINWLLKKFDDLSPNELYAILQLRNEVFAIEQNCVYPDLDNKDQPAYHLMGWSKGLLSENNDKADSYRLVAYTRIMPPGIAYPEPSIGRVVTSPFVRGKGIGRQLMEKSIEHIYKIYGTTPVKISSQLYLKRFYAELGFFPTGDVYLEDGIEHIKMVKP
jgi:ElaA protein